VLALLRGLGAMYVNDTRKSQLMMRYRVLFQFGTVSAVVGGIYWRAYRTSTNPEGAWGGGRVHIRTGTAAGGSRPPGVWRARRGLRTR
jgi:hypothetical protein